MSSPAHSAIRAWAAAVRADEYLIMLTSDHKGGGRGSPRRYTAEQLCSDKVIGYLRGQNARGMNVFVKPKSGYMLIDEVGIDQPSALWCAAIVRTSPYSAQWWVAVESYHSADKVLPAACKRLGNGFGRLPGLVNRKDCYRDAQGHYPWILLSHSRPATPVYSASTDHG